MTLALTVPTAGSRPQLLHSLIEDSGLPPEMCVVVATRPGLELPEGVTVVEDLGEVNIQRWWNVGIQAAVRMGADTVAVVNDDVAVGRGALTALASALHDSGAVIASPLRPGVSAGLHRGRLLPYFPRLWGSLWVLDASTSLRPDERYRWWYGDNDLDIRARRDYGGVVLVDVEYEHLHAGEGTGSSPQLQSLIKADEVTFERDYGRLLRMSRRIRSIQRLLRRPVPAQM